MVDKYKRAIERLGSFGHLFIDYEGYPRGVTGRLFLPLEEEVLAQPEVIDIEGVAWIPVQAEALHELVEKYVAQRPESGCEYCNSRIMDTPFGSYYEPFTEEDDEIEMMLFEHLDGSWVLHSERNADHLDSNVYASYCPVCGRKL